MVAVSIRGLLGFALPRIAKLKSWTFLREHLFGPLIEQCAEKNEGVGLNRSPFCLVIESQLFTSTQVRCETKPV